MKRTWVVALLAGVAAALAVSGLPAWAADQAVTANAGNTWSDPTVEITVNQSVSWSNATGTSHTICVHEVGQNSGCGKYGPYPTPASGAWASPDVVFDTDNATYKFQCTIHASMNGTIKVGNGSPTTTTDTTPTTTSGTNTTPTTTSTTNTTPTNTTPTNTTPTNTTPAADVVKPRFVGAVKRKGAKLSFQLSEKSSLTALVERKAPGSKKFKRLTRKTTSLGAGKRTLALARKLKKGSYRVTLVLKDSAGNKSAPKVLKFKLA